RRRHDPSRRAERGPCVSKGRGSCSGSRLNRSRLPAELAHVNPGFGGGNVKKLTSIVVVGPLAMLVSAAVSWARPSSGMYHLSATLNAGQEIPKQVVKNQSAHGSFTATLSGTPPVCQLAVPAAH